MTSNIESYPFSESPGKEIGRGYTSIVKELGPDWVIKEFNPLKPDGTPKDKEAFEKSQNPSHIQDLQETQRILSQDSIYGSKILPTYWVLRDDQNGKEKYITIQKRFKGETLEALRDQKRFTKFFNENRDLREQMLELMWGSKKALVEMGICDDLHVGNIALVEKDGKTRELMLFDIPNLIEFQKILYGQPPASTKVRKYILAIMETRASRLEKYEKWIDVTEEEKLALDQKFGIENGKYSNVVNNLLQMKKQQFLTLPININSL
ncbi:MAG TPA: hypothetical protein VLI92_00955 [Candidatus Saccharimonadales bacterium]|nr:hypothetical protein [Candidatus Saccharimonadales bacterium]